MNSREVIDLGKWCAAAFPAQKWGDTTPDVWAEMLEPFSADDARAAAKVIVARQPFIALSDLITEIKLIRRKRFNGINPDVLGAGAPADDVGAFLEAVKADVKAIGDGDAVADPELGELRPVAALVAGLAVRRSIREPQNAHQEEVGDLR